MHGRPLQLCAQRVLGDKEDLQLCAQRLQLSAKLEDLKGSTTEYANQNCGFSKELNKTQFCRRNPYTGGEPCYILCCGSLCCFCYVLSCIDKCISDK